MEIISSPFSGGLSWYNKKSRARRNGATTTRKKMKTVKLGGSPQRAWRIKAAAPKLRLKVVLLSPFKLMKKLKNAYLNMMVSLSGDGSKAFGEKRIPKARHAPIAYSNAEFDKRLVMEIYKSLVISRELATN